MDSAHRHPALNIIPLADLSDPRLDPYRNQKDAWLRSRKGLGTGLAEGLFLAEGELVVRQLLASPCEIVSVLGTPARLEAMGEALAAVPPETPRFSAERALLEQIVGFDLHRGVLALGRRRNPPDAAALIGRSRLLVCCEDLANLDNMGAIFRNVACLAGVPDGDVLPAAVLLSPRSCDPLYRKSLRVSMGHALRVPFARLSPWREGLETIAAAGFETIALTPDPSAIPLDSYERNKNKHTCILLGAEGPGLTPGTISRAAVRLRIPMARGADSVNVATALAILLSRIPLSTPPESEPTRGPPRP